MKPRCVRCDPHALYFKPRGIPMVDLQEVRLARDELEAIRLADLEGLHQADGAVRMGVSRPTFGRILKRGRRKVARAVIRGEALRIENQQSERGEGR